MGMAALFAGGVAAVLIVVSTFVKTIIPLRWLAVGSNLGFVFYGALQPSWLVLALHLTLLPVNVQEEFFTMPIIIARLTLALIFL